MPGRWPTERRSGAAEVSDWDEKVQGYEGPDSYLNYVGKMVEKLVVGNSIKPQIESTDKPAVQTGANEIKTRDGKPVMRK